MKSLNLLIMTAVLGISTHVFAGGGGGGGVLQMASFTQNDFLVYGLDSNAEERLVAVATLENGKWLVSKEVIQHSELQRRPELNGAILKSELTSNWAPVSVSQGLQR